MRYSQLHPELSESTLRQGSIWHLRLPLTPVRYHVYSPIGKVQAYFPRCSFPHWSEAMVSMCLNLGKGLLTPVQVLTVNWPRRGLSAQDAIGFVEEETHKGSVSIEADSMYCYRWLQNYLPIRFIAVSNPVTPVGFTDPSHLNARVAAILAYRDGLMCNVYAPGYDSLWDGLRLLDTIKRSFSNILNGARGRDARVMVTDLPDATATIASEVNKGAVAMVVDEIECLWNIQNDGLLRTATIVDKPAFLLAAAEPEVAGLLGVRGRPVVLLVDRHGDKCIARGFWHNRGSELSLRDAVRLTLTLLMTDRGVINAPLEVLISGGGREA